MAEEVVPENLKKQLALAVRSIQWGYAIFWSISTRQPGVLEWGDGYYNGDIKTRKTVQSIELNADQLGLLRSEQLRELYESLSAGEASPQARRRSAALSPEDLTDTEWYYLVCMSFVFNIGQGLPGRTLANGQPIWLCNANFADSKVFTRSLLAKSASIQTVVCFPFLGGVVELGVTELVLEDPSVIHHVKTSFLEIPYPFAANNTLTRNEEELAGAAFDLDILDTKLIPVVGSEELDAVSGNNSSNIRPAEDSFMVEGINVGCASQVQSWQLMEDDFSDCISQTIVNPVKVVPVSNNERVKVHCLRDVEDCNYTKLTALDLQSDELHYQSFLSSLLKTSHPLVLGSLFQNSNKSSSFVGWKQLGMVHYQKSKGEFSQKLLKKILFEVPKMHVMGLLKSPEEKSNRVGVCRPEADEVGANNALLKRKRREKLHERFMTLKSIVPSINKVDKVAILDDTIEYVHKLRRRVQQLESCKESTKLEARTRTNLKDAVERTSDNYGCNRIGNNQKPLINKRKASDIDEVEAEIEYNISKEGSAEISVSMNDKDVVIEMKCPWREGLLLEIMDAVGHLHLDSHSVQSSTIDGILSLTIKSKKGVSSVSAGAIKPVLQRVARKC